MKTCATCKWAKFEMTKHKPPRIRAEHMGECLIPMPAFPVLPKSVTDCGFHKREDWTNAMKKGHIWPNLPHCIAWKAA